ncbi:helix-turn-helix domain-containing protein [Portibacter marinus]|uniref:helix-turn-helix domain-containing protein n=1 Tax=Portibacter marinus TaxID=2898660 RepID=UPI001F48AE7B|nr:AraC family transcriptional regulator [Portibacter marinus]
MKALPFNIPKTGNTSFVIQQDKMDFFYPYLHKHEEIQICWIKKGEGTLIVQADIYRFKKGDVFIIASNRAHLFKNETDKSVETLSLFFSTNPLNNILMNVPEMEESRKYFNQISSCNLLDPQIHTLLERIYKSNYLQGLSHFIELLELIIHTLPKETNINLAYSDKSENKLRKTIEFTMENMTNPIQISDLAKYTNYTPEAFCRFFKKRTGRTYIDYLNDLRVNVASQKILQQEVSDIKSIAFSTGFNNVSHFNRVFKKYKGCSPLQFKKEQQIQTPFLKYLEE